MKLTIESTQQMVEVGTGDVGNRARYVPARVWVGTTESGIPVQVLVTRIAVANEERQGEFQRELAEQHAPRPEPQAFPLRMVL